LLRNTIKDAEKFIEKGDIEEKKLAKKDQNKAKPKTIDLEKKNLKKK